MGDTIRCYRKDVRISNEAAVHRLPSTLPSPTFYDVYPGTHSYSFRQCLHVIGERRNEGARQICVILYAKEPSFHTSTLRRGQGICASRCQSGNYLRIWADSRELNANRRALFANEKRRSVMIFESKSQDLRPLNVAELGRHKL